MQFLENYSLLPHNTLAVNCLCDFFCKIDTKKDLVSLVETEIWKTTKKLILGGGSNVLFTKDFNGLVVKIDLQSISKSVFNDDTVLVTASAGVVWDDFVDYCVGNNFGGLENLSLIPGTVGASPFQNIGAYGVEVKDTIHEVEVFNTNTKKFEVLNNSDCEFGYRNSIFKRQVPSYLIITAVVFKLTTANHLLNTSYGAIRSYLSDKNIEKPSIKDIRDVVCLIRKSKLPNPKEIPNAGSFFKNPIINEKDFSVLIKKHPDLVSYKLKGEKYKIAAGWMIEKLGWKGKTLQNAGVHTNQALVLINANKATGKNIFDLSNKIIEDVNQKFGIELEREVSIVC